MEDTLWEKQDGPKEEKKKVLILVLMEDTLWGRRKQEVYLIQYGS